MAVGGWQLGNWELEAPEGARSWELELAIRSNSHGSWELDTSLQLPCPLPIGSSTLRVLYVQSEISLSRETLPSDSRAAPTRTSSGSSAENAPKTSGLQVKFLRYAHSKEPS